VVSPSIGTEVWIPTAEDIVVQKLRWGRNKDLDDARDVLAVQGTDFLDMPYIETGARSTARRNACKRRSPKSRRCDGVK